MKHTKENSDLSEQDWLFSRKKFVRTLILSGVALQIPWLQACSSNDENFGDTSPLSLNQFKTVREVQEILFPDDGNGPGALQINADEYLLWVIRDSLLDPKGGNYIIERIDQFSEACRKTYKTTFSELSTNDKSDFVKIVSKEDWGKKWLSRLLTLIFEALLLNPNYGGNPDEMGWTWLEHDPGNPRPTQKIMYPAILKKHEV